MSFQSDAFQSDAFQMEDDLSGLITTPWALGSRITTALPSGPDITSAPAVLWNITTDL